MKQLIKPFALRPGDTIGVFTPSTPGYVLNKGLFENGVRVLESLGFRVKLGSLTSTRASQGYRSGTPEERAREFMELIHDPDVRGLVSTIGGANSSSLIPYLDFDAIRASRKVICGYSDITSLHLSILHYARLSTFYGPGVMTWFGEWPDGFAYTNQSFMDATTDAKRSGVLLTPPEKWSNHKRDWASGAWKNAPREYEDNPGWKVLTPGTASAPMVVANLNTLLSAAGTEYFPDLEGKILLVEEMDAPLSEEERLLRHLQLMGVFDQIAGLVVSKPEILDLRGANFSYDDLILEVVGSNRPYPIVSQFDCGHTVPMLTLAEEVSVRLAASADGEVEVELLEAMVADPAR